MKTGVLARQRHSVALGPCAAARFSAVARRKNRCVKGSRSRDCVASSFVIIQSAIRCTPLSQLACKEASNAAYSNRPSAD